MKNTFKNPIFWGFVLFLGGMIVGGFGIDWDQSQIVSRAAKSTALIICGSVMIVAGIAIFFSFWNRK